MNLVTGAHGDEFLSFEHTLKSSAGRWYSLGTWECAPPPPPQGFMFDPVLIWVG